MITDYKFNKKGDLTTSVPQKLTGINRRSGLFVTMRINNRRVCSGSNKNSVQRVIEYLLNTVFCACV